MTTTPKRIQRRRSRGWTAPLDAEGRRPVYVGRGSKWGNPFKIGGGYRTRGLIDCPSPIDGPYVEGTYYCTDVMGREVAYEVRTVADAAEAVELFRRFYERDWAWFLGDLKADLGGRTLMCWCSEDAACHGDLLLEWANEGDGCG